MFWESAIGIIFTFIGYGIVIILVLNIIRERKDASSTIAWILTLLFLPYLGVILYLLLAGKVEKRRIKRRFRAIAQVRPELSLLEQKIKRVEGYDFDIKDPNIRQLIKLSAKLADFPPTFGNEVIFLSDGKVTFEEIEKEIVNAKEHIHLEYYIFKPDNTGKRILSLLEEASKKGVEVRLLYDWIGSYSLKEKHLTRLKRAGGKVAPFMPLFSFRRPFFGLNFRTHRKLLIIDGKICFVGGRNIGDEYATERGEKGSWHDCDIKIIGPSVHRLQEIFVEDWMFATGEELAEEKYFQAIPSFRGDNIVQVLVSGPDSDIEVLHWIFFTLINSARTSIYIVTPYFVPDLTIEVSLKVAAMKGIDVRLLCPGKKTDIPLIRYASFAYLPELVASGVKVYEFIEGMHHAKLVVVDKQVTYIGSANMDMRSFRLNFEVGALIYGERFAEQVIAYIEDDLNRSRLMRPTDFAFGIGSQFFINISKLLSPLL